jgi:hypothetical protein
MSSLPSVEGPDRQLPSPAEQQPDLVSAQDRPRVQGELQSADAFAEPPVGEKFGGAVPDPDAPHFSSGFVVT